MNVERVKRRVLVGGHGIPKEKVKARYARSLKFLPRAAETAHLTYVYDNSNMLMLVGHFMAGVWQPAEPIVPSYLRKAFVEPIQSRHEERKVMANLREDNELDLPDEENGQYTGTVVAAGEHYLIQEVIENGLSTLYRHDALWLAEPLEIAWKGRTALIHYGQADYGLATISFP